MMPGSTQELQPLSSGDGLEFRPGDEHYRAYVGPPRDYDLVAAMVFNLLTCLGLRQSHKVLDVGCGSLRVGRLLIPYLQPGLYVGVEPNEWLVKDGILNEIGQDGIRIKRPVFSFRPSLSEFTEPLGADFAVAQSIFSHCSLGLFDQWLQEISLHLNDRGALLATFLPGDDDFEGSGWIYPGVVQFLPSTVQALAEKNGFHFQTLDWAHPRQTWAIFAKPGHDLSLVAQGQIGWNQMMQHFGKNRAR